MITKEIVKKEIDHFPEDHLDILYKIIKAFEAESFQTDKKGVENDDDWRDFVNQTYGCMADHPISRGDQGVCEVREKF